MLASAFFLGGAGSLRLAPPVQAGCRPLRLDGLLTGLWALGNALEISTPDFETRVFWLKVQMAVSLFSR